MKFSRMASSGRPLSELVQDTCEPSHSQRRGFVKELELMGTGGQYIGEDKFLRAVSVMFLLHC